MARSTITLPFTKMSLLVYVKCPSKLINKLISHSISYARILYSLLHTTRMLLPIAHNLRCLKKSCICANPNQDCIYENFLLYSIIMLLFMYISPTKHFQFPRSQEVCTCISTMDYTINQKRLNAINNNTLHYKE
jgi:hypothetical protein